MSHNLANLPQHERESIEEHKKDCLKRWHEAKDYAILIHIGLKGKKGRDWAVREIDKRPDIKDQVRKNLNDLLRVKR